MCWKRFGWLTAEDSVSSVKHWHQQPLSEIDQESSTVHNTKEHYRMLLRSDLQGLGGGRGQGAVRSWTTSIKSKLAAPTPVVTRGSAAFTWGIGPDLWERTRLSWSRTLQYLRTERRDFFVLFLSLCLHDPVSLRLLDLSHNPETTWWNQMWSQDSDMIIMIRVTQAQHASWRAKQGCPHGSRTLVKSQS